MGIGFKRSELGGGSPAQKLIMQEALSLTDPDNEANTTLESSALIDPNRTTLLSLDVPDEELLRRAKNWDETYKNYFGKISTRQTTNERYWIGKSYGSALESVRDYGASDPVIFESFENLLPLITRENPEPVVNAIGTQDTQDAADTLGHALVEIASTQSLKVKMRESARHWGIWLLGVTKIAWDTEENTVQIYNVLPENISLDPKGRFDGGKFNGEWVGEAKTESAETLIKRFPDQEEKILEKAKGNRSVFLKYQEYWTPDFVFWKLGDVILDKRQNINWNWDEEAGVNHLTQPSMPYAFVYYFSNGRQPHDETSLIEQCIPLQDVVNKRLRQIDKNADDTNNGWVFNNSFTEDNGSRALQTLRKGGAIIAPTPSINEAVMRFQAPPLPSFIFDDMLDKREQIRNIFGVRGTTAAGIASERTVQGKIEIKGADADRVMPIVEQIERTEKWIYDYIVQMIYVYFTESMLAYLVGAESAQQFFATIQSLPFKANVEVKEGSTIPQDPLLRRNEAIEMFNLGALDPVTLFERMDFPNPEETANKLVAWKQGQVPTEETMNMPGAPAPLMPPTL